MTIITPEQPAPARPRVLLLVPARTYRAADFLLAAARMELDLVIGSDGALPLRAPRPGIAREAARLPGRAESAYRSSLQAAEGSPLAGDQATVPAQDGTWGDQPVRSQPPWPEPDQRGEDRPVGPVQLRPGILPPQHRDLVSQR